MKKGLVFTATLAALTLGLVACGGNKGTPVKDVTINNKDVLQEEWFVEDADRPINMSIEGVRIAEAIDAGDLVVTSSDPAVFTVASSMQKIHAEGAGTATLTATYKKTKKDSVEIQVKVRPSMRVVTQLDTTKEDYYLRYKTEGVYYFASDEMSGFYIKPVLRGEEKPVKVQEDANPSGDYKYTITIGNKMIGAYNGTHKNIGFVGDQVEDDGPHDLTKALFKFNSNSTFSTNFFGSTEYFLAAYGGASTDRIAYQQATDSFPSAGLVRLVELGDPIPATALSVNPTELSVHAGAQARITATITPADSTDEIVWTSSDKTVATVNQDGLVTGVAQSATPVTITATAGNYSASCQVTVLEALNYGTAENPLTADEAYQFLDDNFSDGSLTPQRMYVTGLVTEVSTHSRPNIWLQKVDGSVAKYFELYSTVLDEGVAAVEVGDTVVCKGFAKIYNGTHELTSVKLESGAYDNPTVISNVKAPIPELTGIEVSPKTSEVNLNGVTEAQTVQLTAAPVPAKAELGEVTWKSSDANVTVVNGLVTIPADLVAAGEADKEITITATVPQPTASRGDPVFYDTATIVVKNDGDVPVVGETVTLTAQSLLGYDGTGNVAYSTEYANSTVDGVAFTYQQIGAYKSGFAGMQFRNKLSDSSNKTKSNLNNTAAFEQPVLSIDFTWHADKDIKTNSDVLKITFDTVATFDSANAEVIMLNTVENVKEMTVTPVGKTWTFVKIEIDDDFRYTCYWDNIKINLVAGEAPVEIPQPQGTFFASAELSDNGIAALTQLGVLTDANQKIVPIFVTLGENNAVALSVNGKDFPVTFKSYDKTTGELKITHAQLGDLSMIYDPETTDLTKLSAGGLLKYDGGQSLRGNDRLKYWNCDGTTEELQAQFNRRYGNPWNLDTTNTDRVTQNTEHAISGSAMRLRPYSSDRIALATKDFAEPFNCRNISFWVYVDGTADMTIQCFGYKQTGYGTTGMNNPFSNKTIKAGQWTYISAGFTAADLYAFQIFVAAGASALIFDDICLF